MLEKGLYENCIAHVYNLCQQELQHCSQIHHQKYRPVIIMQVKDPAPSSQQIIFALISKKRQHIKLIHWVSVYIGSAGRAGDLQAVV